MTNLDELYSTDLAFRSIVVEAAAAAIGSTSPEFAEEWLALPAEEDKPVGSLGRENLRVEIAGLEAQVERLRGKLGEAADLACAIERTCMDGYGRAADVEREVGE